MSRLKKIIVSTILVISLFVLLYPQTKRGISFLDSNLVISSDLVVIEGWISAGGLHHVFNYVKEHEVNHILISGGLETNYCKLFQNGSIIFIPPKPYDSCINVKVVAFGSKAKFKYPKVKVTCQSCETDTLEVSKNPLPYAIKCKDLVNDTIIFEFINDEVTRHNDRNLFVSSVLIDKDTFGLPSPNFYIKRPNKSIVKQEIVSNPDYLKSLLINEGINGNRISILYQPKSKFGSKTLLTAENSIVWMIKNGYNNAMIFTGQNHTKGTLLSYTFKGDKHMKFGIQGVQLKKHNSSPLRTKEFCRIMLLKFLLLFK